MMNLIMPKKPYKFTHFRDYLVPLLSLMGKIGAAPLGLTTQELEFNKYYGQFIPSKDRKIMDNGKERWAYNLEWTRTDLAQLGLINNPSRGMWAISDEGHLWLETHPDFNDALLSLEVTLSTKTRFLPGKVKTKKNYKLQMGKHEHQTKSESLIIATIEQNDDRKIRLAPNSKVLAVSKASTDFKAMQTFLLEKCTLHEHPKINQEKNSVEIAFSNLTASHYAFRFTRNEAEIGFYLQSLIPRVNHERIESIQPLTAQWSQAIGQEVTAENWGTRWARVYIFTNRFAALAPGDYEQMTQTANVFTHSIGMAGKIHPDWEYNKITAEAFATLLVRFIETTYSDLVTHTFSRRHIKTTKPSVVTHTDDPEAHQLLDQKIIELRGFLAGRLVRTPKDEELCDWIQLCYLFDLHREGQQLFSFVQPQTLNNDWLYHRTKKYADLCRLKANLKG